jgi:hypothetical protein
MRRLDVELPGGRVDPFRAVSVAREDEGVDHSIDVENTDLELTVRWRGGNG